jgi:hypothetical protein
MAVAGVILLAAAGSRHDTLLRLRAERHMVPESEMADAPPLVSFSMVVLGGFRGILADVLWLRATHLQDEGQYVELVQLSDWITKLEPRSTDIWQYHAWNMAYNVSVMMADPEDRWRWVWNGILLLRDQGLRYNPDDPGIHAHLAWIFHHKIGGNTDDTSPFYRRKWAKLMQPMLIQPADPHQDGDAHSPSRNPQTGRHGASFQLDDENIVRLLKDTFKLMPERIRMVEERYGPLDWRLPETHAIYWAYAGLAAPDINRQRIMCMRIIYQCMATQFFQGTLAYDPLTGRYIRLARLDLLDKVFAAYEDAVREIPDGTGAESLGYFTMDAIRVLAAFGENERAEALYAALKTRHPALAPGARVADMLTAEPRFSTRLANGCEPLALVEGALRQAAAARRIGVTTDEEMHEKQALAIWHLFADPLPDAVRRRMDIPTFEEFRNAVYTAGNQ